MNEFRRYWKDGALAASKKRERLRGFFRYCAEQDWIGKNPARLIPSPAVPDDATTPLSEAEPARIWEALPVFIRERKQRARGPESDHLERLGWLLELMLWCGPSILDAVLVTPDQIKKGVLTLRRAKTHTKVPGVPLPPFLSAALDQLPPFPGGSYFWTGKGKPETACGNYRRSIRDLGVAARVSGLHPHRFRNTFTKRLLSQGVPIEDVAKFMGHRSIEVTQRITMPGSTSANLPRAIACARRSRRCSQLIRD
jgi:integrase